jgi:uncharacterized protein
MSDESPRVTHNAAAGRFEIRSEHGMSVLKYTHEGNALDLVHTEVPPALEGQGYGQALVQAAVEHARREGMKIIPSCPFVKHYVEGHPDVAPLVAARGTG